MMSFDPSTIGSISEGAGDPVGAEMKGISIKDMMDREQLNSLQLHSAKAQASEDAQVKSILKDSKYGTPQEVDDTAAKINRVSPRAAMDFKTQTQKYQSGQIQNQLDQWTVTEKRAEAVFSEFDPIRAQAQEIKNKGGSDLDANAYIAQQLPQVLQKLRNAKGPDGQPMLPDAGLQEATSQPMTLARLTALDSRAKQGLESIKAQKEQFQADTQAKHEEATEKTAAVGAQREAEVERENRAKDSRDERRIAATTGGFTPEIAELQAAFAERGTALPAGMRSRQQMVSAFQGLLDREPNLSPDQIADKVAKGQLGFGVSKTEASVLGRREAAILPVEKSITKPGGFLDQAEQAVKEVDFSKLKAAGAFEKWGKDQLSDPSLTAYKAAVAELRAEYSIVLSKGGQVTDAARHEAEKVIPDLITKDQFKRIRSTVLNGIESSKGGVEESISGITGQPSAGATNAPGSQSAITPGAAAAAPAVPPLQPGSTYQHKSGAKVQILEN